MSLRTIMIFPDFENMDESFTTIVNKISVEMIGKMKNL